MFRASSSDRQVCDCSRQRTAAPPVRGLPDRGSSCPRSHRFEPFAGGTARERHGAPFPPQERPIVGRASLSTSQAGSDGVSSVVTSLVSFAGTTLLNKARAHIIRLV